MKDSIAGPNLPPLMQAVFTLLQAHQPAFRQGRTYRRAMGLVFGELYSFGRHTLTQNLLTLGITDGDWSAWYRLWSRPRFDEGVLADCFFRETLPHAPATGPYCVALDGTSIHRSSLKMPGSSWLKDTRFAAFRPGIHRALLAWGLVGTAPRGLQPCLSLALSSGFSPQGHPR